MELKFNDEQLQKLIGTALVQAMDQQGKDALIGTALTHLVTKKPESSHFNARHISPIEQAFEAAVFQQARKFAEEVVSTSDFAEKMSALVNEAAQKIFAEENRVIVVEKIVAGIRDAMSKSY